MSKYTNQDRSDERGQNIFQYKFDENLFDIMPFGRHDKTPDIDGVVRLRDGKGTSLNKYLHYQLRSRKEIKNGKFNCDRRTIDFLRSTNVPTVLVLVANSSEKVYWYYFDDKKVKSLRLGSDNKGRTLYVGDYEVKRDNQVEIHKAWVAIGRESDYEKSNTTLQKSVSDFGHNMELVLGLLYLLQKTEKSRVADIMGGLLQISRSEGDTIINRLVQEELIISTKNYFLVENERVGSESLETLLDDFGSEELERRVINKGDKHLILRSLAQMKHRRAEEYLKKEGKKTLVLVKSAKNNSRIFDALDLLGEYAFRVPESALKIVKTIIEGKKLRAVSSVRNFALVYGFYERTENEGIVLKCTDILEQIRYLVTKQVFGILTKLYSSTNATVSKAAEDTIRKIVTYNLHVLRNIGFRPQEIILGELGKWGRERLKQHLGLVCAITKEVLKPSFEGHEMSDYKTVVLSFGSLQVSEKLKRIRHETIELLKKIYVVARTVDERKEVLNALEQSTQTPHRGGHGRKEEQMVRSDAVMVVEFYLGVLPRAENEVIKAIEKTAGWLQSRFKRLPKLNQLRSSIESLIDYQIFRTLVGYDTDVPPDEDWQEARRRRQENIQKIINDITDENFDDWRGKLLGIAANYADSTAGEYGYFRFFLRELGQKKPNVALKLLKENESELESFLADILVGIWFSDSSNAAKKVMRCWIRDDGRKLSTCADVFTYRGVHDRLLVKKLMRKAEENRNPYALNKAIGNILENYDHKEGKTLILHGIRKLREWNNTDWIKSLWYLDEKAEFLGSLNEKENRTLLSALSLTPTVNYHVEQILKPMAEKSPKLVIEFFQHRVEAEVKGFVKRQGYDAIPYELHELKVPLEQNCEVIVPGILGWYRKRNWRYRWEASRLIKIIFPTFNVVLERQLVGLIKSKEVKKARIVLDILRAYEGETFLHGICKEFVKVFGDKKECTDSLFFDLSNTGIVGGEYGFVKAYEKKREEIQGWKKDRNSSVRKFARQYEKFLDSRISAEKERADEDLSLFKKGLR